MRGCSGLGPTIAMSPRRMLTSCGSSSSLTRRKKLPKRNTRASAAAVMMLPPLPFDSTCIVRSLYIVNTWPSRPVRRARKRIGPLLLSRMPIAMSASSGLSTTSAAAASSTSSSRRIMLYRGRHPIGATTPRRLQRLLQGLHVVVDGCLVGLQARIGAHGRGDFADPGFDCEVGFEVQRAANLVEANPIIAWIGDLLLMEHLHATHDLGDQIAQFGDRVI